ncbi:MAG: transposase [Candidatus Pacebacteria bacterium]|nr:transposase [Candidatus Paceibacterota bacterium]
MPNKNYNPKIHHQSMRLKDYDYSQDGYYFVTICVKNKTEYFGEIINGKMILNEYGEIAKKQWLWLTEQYNYVKLDEWIIMLNHLHGILIIENGIKNIGTDRVVVGAGRDLPLRPQTQKIKPLSELIGAFKTTSSNLIHQNSLSEFQWQRNYYDRIIRNEKELDKIRKYIFENPLKWELDRNNPENLFM